MNAESLDHIRISGNLGSAWPGLRHHRAHTAVDLVVPALLGVWFVTPAPIAFGRSGPVPGPVEVGTGG